MQAAARDVPAAGDSGASARTCVTSGWRSQWPLPSPRTKAHSARRRQGPGKRHEKYNTATFREAPLPQGGRPPCLGEPPQDNFQKHTVEQFADDVPMLTLLDSPVPRKVGQLVAALARYDAPVPEQVIEVPKISCPPRFSRSVLRTPQMAEQLVEVPVPSVLEGTAEQHTTTPHPPPLPPPLPLPPFPPSLPLSLHSLLPQPQPPPSHTNPPSSPSPHHHHPTHPPTPTRHAHAHTHTHHTHPHPHPHPHPPTTSFLPSPPSPHTHTPPPPPGAVLLESTSC